MNHFEALIGRELDGRYLIESVIGTGGSAVVFEARDLLLCRPVAIKMLHGEPPRPNSTAARTATAEARAEARKILRASFLREAHAATVLAHPAIVAVYDVCDHPTHPYIVMELVRGKTLSSRLKKGRILSLGETLAIAHDILEALALAHSHGVVHRDIKAENILLTRSGLKIADFGIAKTPSTEARVLEGKVLGSVDTISPEQASGREVDGRSDLYSLGVLLYQMATGRLPFEGEDPETVAFMHINEPPKYPSTINPNIARGLEQIILCAMEKDPDKRFADAAAMLAAIERLERNPNHVFRRFSPVLRSPLASLGRHAAILSVSLGVACAILCGLFVYAFGGKEILPTPVTVITLPSYVESTYPAVEEEITALDPRITLTLTCVLRPDLPEGTVLAQMPEAGALFKLDGEDDRVNVVLIITTQKQNEPGLLPPSIFG